MRRELAVALAVTVLAGCAGSDEAPASGASGLVSPTISDQQPIDDTPEEPTLGSTAEPVSTNTGDVPPPSTVPTSVQDVIADAALARAALLTLDDFPIGWSEVPQEDDSSNEDLLSRVYECLGPDAVELLNSETEARTGEFTDPDNGSSIDHTVAIAPTAEKAESYVTNAAAGGVAECLTTVYREELPGIFAETGGTEDAELGPVTVGAVNVGDIGDGRFAYRITAPISIDGFSFDLVLDFVAVRVGRSITGLNFLSQFDPTPIERIVQYAELAAARLPG